MSQPPKSVPPALGFEVPDLDLGTVQPAKPPARSRAARSAAVPPESGAHAIRPRTQSAPDTAADFELDLASGTSFELAVEAPGTAPRAEPKTAYLGASAGSLDDDFALDEAMTLEAAAPSVDTRPWPKGRSSEARLGLLTPQSIAERAGYGDARVQFYQAPAYTWRVWSRRRTLAREIVAQKRELARREGERDRLLVELTLSLTAALSKQDRFREILAELSSAGQAFEGHERALAGTNAAIGKELEVHDAELARLGTEQIERAKVVQTRRSERDAKATLQQRAHAKLKRVQIEIRNATEKGRALLGPRGGALPDELARQLSDLGATEAVLLKELTGHQAELDQANAALAAGERPLAETQRAIEAVRREKRRLIESTRQKVESKSSQAKDAEAAHTEVAKRIAHAVLDMKGSIPVDRAMLDSIQVADDRVETTFVDVEKLSLAREAFDRASYGLGLKLAFAPFAFVVLLLLLRAIL